MPQTFLMLRCMLKCLPPDTQDINFKMDVQTSRIAAWAVSPVDCPLWQHWNEPTARGCLDSWRNGWLQYQMPFLIENQQAKIRRWRWCWKRSVWRLTLFFRSFVVVLVECQSVVAWLASNFSRCQSTCWWQWRSLPFQIFCPATRAKWENERWSSFGDVLVWFLCVLPVEPTRNETKQARIDWDIEKNRSVNNNNNNKSHHLTLYSTSSYATNSEL